MRDIFDVTLPGEGETISLSSMGAEEALKSKDCHSATFTQGSKEQQ